MLALLHIFWSFHIIPQVGPEKMSKPHVYFQKLVNAKKNLLFSVNSIEIPAFKGWIV